MKSCDDRDDHYLLDFAVEARLARLATDMFESGGYGDWDAVRARLLALIPQLIMHFKEHDPEDSRGTANRLEWELEREQKYVEQRVREHIAAVPKENV
jgi:hypothetical protein